MAIQNIYHTSYISDYKFYAVFTSPCVCSTLYLACCSLWVVYCETYHFQMRPLDAVLIARPSLTLQIAGDATSTSRNATGK